jgi:hypothetical protein
MTVRQTGGQNMTPERHSSEDVAFLREKGFSQTADEIERLTAEVDRLRGALSEIAERHVPDQPMALDIPEVDYIRRQHTELRRMAREALR